MENRKINKSKKYAVQIIQKMNEVINDLYSVEFVEPFIRKLILGCKIGYIDQEELNDLLISYMDNRSISYEGMAYYMYLTRDEKLQEWIENKIALSPHPFTSDSEYLNKILLACDNHWEDKEMYPLLFLEEKCKEFL